jgi:hypothetical protein
VRMPNQMLAAITIRGSAAGHPNVRATHRKTIELVREDEITARATCVIGVAAAIDEEALPALRGRVELTIAVSDLSATVRGRINPAFRPGDPLVVRRADAVTRDAVMIDASAAAADLDRELVARLASSDAVVEIRFRSLDEIAPGTLIVGLPGVSADGGPIDVDSRGEKAPRPDLELRSPLGDADVARALEALDDARRVSVTASLDDGDAIALVAAAHDAGHDVLPAEGLDPNDAALAVAGIDPASATVAAGVPADRVGTWLRKAVVAERGAILLDPGTPREQVIPWGAGERPRIPGARGRTAVVAAGAGAGKARGGEPGAGGAASTARGDPSPDLLARARELTASGASTRDVAALLRDEGGLARGAAYELALELAGRTPDTSNVSRPEPRTSR